MTYRFVIESLLNKYGYPNANSRYVEAFIRSNHANLDTLSAAEWKAAIERAVERLPAISWLECEMLCDMAGLPL